MIHLHERASVRACSPGNQSTSDYASAQSIAGLLGPQFVVNSSGSYNISTEWNGSAWLNAWGFGAARLYFYGNVYDTNGTWAISHLWGGGCDYPFGGSHSCGGRGWNNFTVTLVGGHHYRVLAEEMATVGASLCIYPWHHLMCRPSGASIDVAAPYGNAIVSISVH